MESNVRMLQPEVLLRTMRYLTADRSQAEPLSPTYWTDAEDAYGYAQGNRQQITFYDRPELNGEYVVCDPPLLGSQSRQTKTGETVQVPMVTVYMVLTDVWAQMERLPAEEQNK
ncbi:hypothetical protein [Fibrella forsythiae]|uniref:Uncharacterized protein n=1 Tax=Fibrella forsythiae TaxID=2817061 RepID=A0ABS3JBY5_9BACT|nr:hypothetical protein [Fibrella forsythiae]MBO0947502.1 hypothetical protein [Fibrella forsythiae]